jgi:hypothetical protein
MDVVVIFGIIYFGIIYFGSIDFSFSIDVVVIWVIDRIFNLLLGLVPFEVAMLDLVLAGKAQIRKVLCIELDI